MTLGSGWAKAADLIGETVSEIPATEITGFSAPAVEGHVGTLRSVKLPDGSHALIIGARTHYYEDHGVRRVVHSVRTAAAAGAKTMILTNGAGGIKDHWKPGTPVLISDHLNLTAMSPLEGATFIDLTDLYSSRLRDLARSVKPELDEGVYVQFRGPHYETPAEVQMAKAMGGHIVGMSTALEAIAAREAGMAARLHGLRKAFCIYWAENDATTHQIAAMAGHMSLSEVERYTRAADRERMVKLLVGVA